MTRPVIAKCDHCGMMTTINFKERKHPEEIKETYFECVVCNHHYTCFVTDKKVRQMQNKAKNLRAVAKFRNVTDELLALQEKINNRMARLKQGLITNGT